MHKVQVITIPLVVAPHTLEASFVEAPVVVHIITASAGPGGTIEPAGSIEIVEGQDATFVIRADEGFVIDKVLLDGVDIAIH
jgi:hypothetical protein